MRKLILIMVIFPAAVPATEYHVSSGNEFIRAVGSDRTIVIEEGCIRVSDYYTEYEYEGESVPGEYPSEYALWVSSFDGPSLVLHDLENLTIRGSGELACSLLTEYRYAFVLEFRDCDHIRLENIVFGHQPEGYCDKGVLGFDDCTDIVIESCELFGCGTEGLTMKSTDGFEFSNSVIRNCAYGIMSCFQCSDLNFLDSVFRDNQRYWGIGLTECRDVEFADCLFLDNYADYCEAFFELDSCEDVLIRECLMQGIEAPELYSTVEGLTLLNVRDSEWDRSTH